MSNVYHLAASAGGFPRGTQCTYQGLSWVVVHVKGDYRQLGLGDRVEDVKVETLILAHVSKLAAREHYVTIEPVEPVGEDEIPPRLCVAEHQTGEPVYLHGVEGWPLLLGELREQALAVADRLRVPYREPEDFWALHLLPEAGA